MPRYIDAEIFQKNLAIEVYMANDEDFTKAFVRCMELVKIAQDRTPTADVQEVRHGKWRMDYETGDLQCSECGHFTGEFFGDFEKVDGVLVHRAMCPTYCSKCGAKMDGKKTHDD